MATRATGPSAPAENPTLRRADVEAAVEHLVDMFDATEGDPDLELNGDELDGTGAEDDFCDHIVPGHLQGPGCRPSAAHFSEFHFSGPISLRIISPGSARLYRLIRGYSSNIWP
jgi:hypothetical protein